MKNGGELRYNGRKSPAEFRVASTKERQEQTMDYNDLINQAMKQVKNEENKLQHVNILIAGKSGVGKSTLINAAFRADLAQTGMGRPVTKEIQLIEKPGVPIKIYDTVGFELDKKVQKRTIKEIKKLAKEKRKNAVPDDDIHCMWYCVSAPSDRFEDIEENFINDIAALGIPVILVLTKVFSKEAATHLEATIRSLKPKIHSVVQVLAKDSEFVPSFGIKELVEETCELLPASIQNSFVNAQKGSLALKRKKSNLVVKASVATSFGEGFIPIPVADAPLIIATQMAMLAKITTIYGIDIKKNRLETVFASIIGILAATTGGKTAVSSLFKMMPGVGTLVGGMISGGVASLITTALGQSYIQLMELTISGKIDLSELPADQLETMFTDLFSNYLKKFKGLKH